MDQPQSKPPTGESKKTWKYVAVAIVAIVVVAGIVVVLHTSKSSKQTLTVNISLAGSEKAFYVNHILPEFDKAYPNISLQFTYESASTIVSTLQAEEPSPTIDVVEQDNGFVGPLLSSGLVMSLNPYLSQLEPMNGTSAAAHSTNGNIIPAYYNEGNFSGNFYFFPIRGNVQLAYYNQSALTAASAKIGKALPQPTNTTNLMTDLEAMNSSGFTAPFNMQGHQGASTPTQVFQWMAEFGGNPMAFNDTGDIQALTFLQNMIKEKLMSADYTNGYWGTYKGLASDSYQYIDQWPYVTSLLGGLGMNNTSSSAQHNLGINHVFSGPNHDAQYIVGGDELGVVNNTHHLWAAIHYIKFLDSATVQTQLLQNLTWPVVNTAAYTVPQASGTAFKMILYEESHGIFRPAVPWMTQWDSYFDSAWAQITSGTNVATALNSAHANMMSYLNIYYKGTAYPSEYKAGTIVPTGDYTGPA